MYDEQITKYKNCGREYLQNHPDPNCVSGLKMDSKIHTIYLGQPIGSLCSLCPKIIMK